MLPANINLEPDETVLLEMDPGNVGNDACGCIFLGVSMFLIPALIMLLHYCDLRRQYRDSR